MSSALTKLDEPGATSIGSAKSAAFTVAACVCVSTLFNFKRCSSLSLPRQGLGS